MRMIVALVALTGASFARADWMIDSPVGHKIPYGVAKLEYDLDAKGGKVSDSRFGFGIGKSFDFTVHRQTFGTPLATVDVTYAYVAPGAGLSPGVVAGCLDVNNHSGEGRRPYFAISFLEDVDTDDGTLLADVSVGMTFEHSMHGFAAASTPISKTSQLLGEFDGRKVLLGIGYKLRKDLTTRFVIRERQLMVGMQWSKRF